MHAKGFGDQSFVTKSAAKSRERIWSVKVFITKFLPKLTESKWRQKFCRQSVFFV